MQGLYQGEQLPQYAPQQQTQAANIYPASQTGGLSFYINLIFDYVLCEYEKQIGVKLSILNLFNKANS